MFDDIWKQEDTKDTEKGTKPNLVFCNFLTELGNCQLTATDKWGCDKEKCILQRILNKKKK